MNAAPTITLLLDGQAHSLLEGTTLAALVTSLRHEANAVTTAVNGCFVPRAARAEHVLHCGDAVLLFQPIVGG